MWYQIYPRDDLEFGFVDKFTTIPSARLFHYNRYWFLIFIEKNIVDGKCFSLYCVKRKYAYFDVGYTTLGLKLITVDNKNCIKYMSVAVDKSNKGLNPNLTNIFRSISFLFNSWFLHIYWKNVSWGFFL